QRAITFTPHGNGDVHSAGGERGKSMHSWSRKRMTWIIVVTVIITAIAVLLALNFATSEKHIERRVEHHASLADPQFQREMAVLLGPGILPGNQVQAFNNGREIFPAMLEAIRAARTSITFETYIYWSGEIGQEFSDALS